MAKSVRLETAPTGGVRKSYKYFFSYVIAEGKFMMQTESQRTLKLLLPKGSLQADTLENVSACGL